MNRKAEILSQIEDEGLERLPEIFEALLDIARGARVLVLPGERGPRGSHFETQGIALDTGQPKRKRCPTCKRDNVDTSEGTAIEVWRMVPDTALLRYLHEHLAGKAKAKSEQRIDPVIIVQFGPIDTEATVENVQEQLDREIAQDPPQRLGMLA